MALSLQVDGVPVQVEAGWTVLRAAAEAGVVVPSLCAHPDLPPEEDETRCGLCAVEVEGVGEVPACATLAREGMVVRTAGADLEALRRERLAGILAHHPHACLTCSVRAGCPREPCSMGVPVDERCCELLGRCALQHVAERVGIAPTTPRYLPAGPPPITDEPLFDRRPALCIGCGRCIRACAHLEVEALGWVEGSDGQRRAGPLGPTLVEAGCRLCGVCVEVCPTGALVDRGIRPWERDALVPCRTACPAGTDVPRVLRLAAAGRLEEAARVVAETAPLVEVLGLVCPHPCEEPCRRGEVGEPVSIAQVEVAVGAASATAWSAALPPPRPDTGRSVVVVGAGPAGLVAAHRLRLLGHRVTVLEARPAVGGMLAWGIPPFRLPRAVVERETAALLDGVEVRTGVVVDAVALAALGEAHDAVVLATGATVPLRLGMPGEEHAEDGLSFLARVAVGEAAPLSGPVVVVGGGDVAVDCARAAVRLGADPVEVVCTEQLAHPGQVLAADAEGVRRRRGVAVTCFGDGWVGLEDGERIPADVALIAIGQRPDASLPVAGVYLAGDVASGPSTVVEAVASGARVAMEVDRALGGSGEVELHLVPASGPGPLGRVAGFCALPRQQSAVAEADRCLRCDLRLHFARPEVPLAGVEDDLSDFY